MSVNLSVILFETRPQLLDSLLEAFNTYGDCHMLHTVVGHTKASLWYRTIVASYGPTA